MSKTCRSRNLSVMSGFLLLNRNQVNPVQSSAVPSSTACIAGCRNVSYCKTVMHRSGMPLLVYSQEWGSIRGEDIFWTTPDMPLQCEWFLLPWFNSKNTIWISMEGPHNVRVASHRLLPRTTKFHIRVVFLRFLAPQGALEENFPENFGFYFSTNSASSPLQRL
jgi:hypothetical protein